MNAPNNAIDIHTHIVPAEFPAYAGKHVTEFGGKQWPQMCTAHDCHHKKVMIDGRARDGLDLGLIEDEP